MIKLATASLVLLLILGPATAQDVSWIHVTLQDNNGAVIPGLEVTVRDARSKTSVSTLVSNERGEAHFSLPGGRYIIEANGEQIVSYKRAPLRVENNTHTWVIILPLFVSVSASRDELEKRLKYRVFPSLSEDTAVSVRYLAMKTRNGIVEFEGDIELSYESTTLLCDTLRMKSPGDSFECSGVVRLFIGKEQFSGSKCEIDVRRQLASLTRDPVVSLPIK